MRENDSACTRCGHWISREWEFCPCCGEHQPLHDELKEDDTNNPNAGYLKDHHII